MALKQKEGRLFVEKSGGEEGKLLRRLVLVG
jgi:hypothetical protein